MSADHITEDVGQIKQLLANERRIADRWASALDAMRAQRQLPAYLEQQLFPIKNVNSQHEESTEARKATNFAVLGKPAPPVFTRVGCDGRWSDERLTYYVGDSTGILHQGSASDLLCTPGVAECLSPRQLAMMAAALRAEARDLTKGGAK